MVKVGDKVKWSELPSGAMGLAPNDNVVLRLEDRGWWVRVANRWEAYGRPSGRPRTLYAWPWADQDFDEVEVAALGVSDEDAASADSLRRVFKHAALGLDAMSRGVPVADPAAWRTWALELLHDFDVPFMDADGTDDEPIEGFDRRLQARVREVMRRGPWSAQPVAGNLRGLAANLRAEADFPVITCSTSPVSREGNLHRLRIILTDAAEALDANAVRLDGGAP